MPQRSLTQKITWVAILVALEIVLSRFGSISTPLVKIGFAFLPTALMGILFGPLWAAPAAAIADILGATLFPIGAFFPGFTLTALLTGLTYGILFYQQPKGWVRIGIAALVVTLVLNLGLDTLWLMMIMGNGSVGLLPTRLIKCAVMLPVQIVTIHFLWTRLIPLFKRAAH